MSASLHHSSTREALLSAARDHSPADELRCRALLGLLQVGCAFQQAQKRTLDPGTLTDSGFQVLAHLLQHEGHDIASEDLAAALGLPPQVVSASLGRLEVSGFLTRERSSADRGVFRIKATAAGRRAFASMVSHHLKTITDLMSVLDPHELAALELACARLGAAVV